MTDATDTFQQRLGVVAAFVALAALVGGLTYVLPLGFSVSDSVFVAGIVLAFLVVRLTLDDTAL
jgi:hypothetical protein